MKNIKRIEFLTGTDRSYEGTKLVMEKLNEYVEKIGSENVINVVEIPKITTRWTECSRMIVLFHWAEKE